MYTRNVRLKFRAGSTNEFRQLLEQQIIPLLRTQKGFRDEITLVSSKRNEAIAISFWDNRENADAYNHVACLDVSRVLSKVIVSLPIVDTFEVVDSTFFEMASTPGQSVPQQL
jgi:heme-degrading monooxygenase HmoA